MPKNNKISKYVLYCIYFALSSLCFIFLFYNLNGFTVENWDEARHGISAYEMIKNNNYIINTFNYDPDLWNLKPPLSFWTEVLSFKIFGYNLFALRFPSALFYFLTFISLSVFLHKNYGVISTLSFMVIFLSFSDMILSHCARSGDADAQFVFLFTLSMIFLFYSQHKKYFLYLSGFAFSLAFLSKSFHAIPIIGIILLYILVSKLYKTLKLKNYLVFLFSSLSNFALGNNPIYV